MDEILEKYPTGVKIVFKNFPLSSHAQAYKTALYVLAAGKQGKFKEMYHKIFADNAWRGLRNDEDLPLKLAAEIGLDTEQLKKDINDPAIKAQLDGEINQLKALSNSYETDQFAGVRLAAPKFFVNGKESNLGRREIADWSRVIDAELKK